MLTKDSIAAGGTFYVTVGNRVLVVINDSLHIKEATSPNCGQIIVTASMIPLLSDAPATEQISFKNDSTKFSSAERASHS